MTTLYNSQDQAKEKVPAATPEIEPSAVDTVATATELLAEEHETPVDGPVEPEGNLQQTQFAEDIILNAITAEPVSNQKNAPSRQATVPASRGKKFRPLLIGLGVALGVLTIISILMPRNTNQAIMPTPTPTTQSQETAQLTALERELMLLEKDIEAADPLQAKLAFPPVDFTFLLEDATVLQAQQQQRGGSRR